MLLWLLLLLLWQLVQLAPLPFAPARASCATCCCCCCWTVLCTVGILLLLLLCGGQPQLLEQRARQTLSIAQHQHQAVGVPHLLPGKRHAQNGVQRCKPCRHRPPDCRCCCPVLLLLLLRVCRPTPSPCCQQQHVRRQLPARH
jgi:hypothetical protein